MPKASARLRLACCGETCEVPAFLDMRGLLSFWLLWELRLGALNGAQLADRLHWRRGDAPSPGTLYPALGALARAGALRKRRRGREVAYELTPKGRDELACARGYLRILFRDVVEDASATASLR